MGAWFSLSSLLRKTILLSKTFPRFKGHVYCESSHKIISSSDTDLCDVVSDTIT